MMFTMAMDANIRIGSYNCTGMHGDHKINFVRRLIMENKLDVILLQETWLVSRGMHTLGLVHKDFVAHGVSGIPDDQLVIGRPHGGVAIFGTMHLIKW